MKRYLLDTNTVSHFVKAHPTVTSRIVHLPMASLCISAITEGELRFGLAKRPEAKRLHVVVQELLRRIEVLPWDSSTADRYGSVRAELEKRGQTVAPMDLLIAAHALSVDATLVTNDRVFRHIPNLDVEDWSM